MHIREGVHFFWGITKNISFFMKKTSPIYIRAHTRVKICGFERKILILHRFLVCVIAICLLQS